MSSNSSIRVIVDSLSQLMILSEEQAILKFINNLSFVLKDAEAMAIVTLTLPLNGHPNNALSSIFDGMMEMQTEDRKGVLIRRIRLVSIKGVPHRPSWVHFKISDDGVLSFFDESSSLTCTLCGKSNYWNSHTGFRILLRQSNMHGNLQKTCRCIRSNYIRIGSTIWSY